MDMCPEFLKSNKCIDKNKINANIWSNLFLKPLSKDFKFYKSNEAFELKTKNQKTKNNKQT